MGLRFDVRAVAAATIERTTLKLEALKAAARDLYGRVIGRRAPSLINDIITVQLVVATAIGLFSLAGLAWTSQAITDKNLERWASQWTSQLNELGAPLYVADPEETILSIERFVAAYPEESRVDWYTPEGLPLFSVTQQGYLAADAMQSLPDSTLAEFTDAVRNDTPQILEEDASQNNHYRLVGPIWSESFAGDALMLLGSDTTPDTLREMLWMVAVELD
jgi:hypothetical protein